MRAYLSKDKTGKLISIQTSPAPFFQGYSLVKNIITLFTTQEFYLKDLALNSSLFSPRNAKGRKQQKKWHVSPFVVLKIDITPSTDLLEQLATENSTRCNSR